MPVLPKRILILGAFLLTLLVTAVVPASAARIMSGNTVNIPAAETVADTVFAAGSQVVVDGKIDGDLYVAAENVILNGEVTGDVIGAGNQFSQNGRIGGNLRFAGNNIILNNEIGKNVTVAAASIIANEKSEIGQDALFGSGSAIFKGPIGRNLHGGGESVDLAGVIKGKVNLFGVQNLSVSPTAKIGGELRYHGPRKADIASEAQIGGGEKFIYRKTDVKVKKADFWPAFVGAKIVSHLIFGVLSLLLVWFILKTFFPGFLEKLTGAVREKPAETFGWGFLILIATPIIAVLLMITIIGLPIGLAAIALYVASIYLGTLVTAQLLADWLKVKMGWENTNAFWIFLIAALVIQFISAIPFISMFTGLVMAAWGVGSMARILNNLRSTPTSL